MLVRCEQCGAPLNVRDGQVFVECAYCRATNRVRSLRTLAMETPQRWAPPPEWRAPTDVRHQGRQFVYTPISHAAAHPPASGAGPAVAVVSIFAAALGVAAALTAVVSGRGGRLLSSQLGVDMTLPARYPVLTLAGVEGGTGAAQTLTGTVATEVQAAHTQSSCRGYVSRAPTAWLQVDQSSTVRIDAAVPGHDAVLMVRTAGGSFACDDDGGGGLNSRLTLPLAAGRYAVWVGELSSSNSVETFTLTAQTQPAVPVPPVLALLPGAPPTGALVELSARGALDRRVNGFTQSTLDITRDAGPACRGHVGAAPDLVLRLASPRTVRVETQGSSLDATLALRRPDGSWLCDDDSGAGLNAMLTTVLPAGTYPVWVGSYSGGNSQAYSVLVRSAEPRGAPREGAGGRRTRGAARGDGLDVPVGWLTPEDPPVPNGSPGKFPSRARR